MARACPEKPPDLSGGVVTEFSYDPTRTGQTLGQWCVERMGIRLRHRVRPGEGTSDMAARAARRALDLAGLQPADIGLIVLSTYTSDHRTPNTAGLLQARLGCDCPFIQVDAVCPGFVQAAIVATALMDTMGIENALVVSSDAHSVYADPGDYRMQCLVGDGAGAVVLRDLPGSPYGIRAHYLAGSGHGAEATLLAPGAKEWVTAKMIEDRRHYIMMDFSRVYRFAVKKLCESSQVVARRAGWDLDEVNWIIPHQPGRNILMDGARRLEQPEDKFIIVLDHTGNVAGASMPIALDEANRSGKLKDGDKLILPAMGSGLAWGGLAVVWRERVP